MESNVEVEKSTDRITVKTLHGLEEVLANELTSLGMNNVEVGLRAVYFDGTLKDIYKSNLWCRTAIRVLKPIRSFRCMNETDLYKGIQSIFWNDYMDVDGTLAVDAVVSASSMTHSQYAALKTKDAIVDQFRDKYGKRPSVDLNNPSLRIHVYINKDYANISLDSSGESLHMRGYRDEQGVAPLNEVLAAGIVMLTGWDRNSHFIDAMCGSGTIPVEAAMMAANIAPGLNRERFGFMTWKDFDEKMWSDLKEEAFRSQSPPSGFRIIGSDISPVAVRKSLNNVKNAGVDRWVHITRAAFEDTFPPSEGGCLLINPPYGERMELDDVATLYKGIGDTLKKKYAGYSAWIFTSSAEGAKKIGLRATRRIHLFNGPIECRLLKYEIFSGSARDKAIQKNEQQP